MTSTQAATLVLKYLDNNRKARNSYPDADLPIEEAMRLLAESVLKASEPDPKQQSLFAGEKP